MRSDDNIDETRAEHGPHGHGRLGMMDQQERPLSESCIATRIPRNSNGRKKAAAASLLWIAALFFVGIGNTQAQQPAPGPAAPTCACQPGFYQFTLNFSLTCADSNVKGTPGVSDTACILTTLGENLTDVVPVTVSAVSVLEVNQESQVIAQKILRDQNLLSGDTFNYTSITETMTGSLNQSSIPIGIQVFLSAQNVIGEDLVNFFAIEYTNDCDIAPVLSVGQRLGWTYISELGGPTPLYCPAVTMAPTGPTTPSPITAPTAPTDPPNVSLPPVSPSDQPSSPSVPPNAPTVSPVPVPPATQPPETVVPTCAPVGKGNGYYERHNVMNYHSPSKSSKKIQAPKAPSSSKGAPVEKGMGYSDKSYRSPSKGSKKIQAPQSPSSSKGGKGKGSRDSFYGSMMEKINGNTRRLMVGLRPTNPPSIRPTEPILSPSLSPTLCPETHQPLVVKQSEPQGKDKAKISRSAKSNLWHEGR